MGISKEVYFDCNATTPVLPRAAEAAMEVMQTLYGNPSSTHITGLQAKLILESTRKKAARVIGSHPDEIIFTSGATEAIQTAIFSALQSFCSQKNPYLQPWKLLYGATEHKVVPQALQHWVKALNLAFEIIELPVDSNGQINIETLKKELPGTALLCTMAVNNETGVIQNLKPIEDLLESDFPDVLWLVDSVQALGKIDLQLNTRRINYAAFSGHKLYAPKGIGFLYVKNRSPFTPLIVGGGQENGLRSGTENLPGVAALGCVLQYLLEESSNKVFFSESELYSYRNIIIENLTKAFPKIVFNTPFKCSVPTTINFSIPGISSPELLALFDSAGLRVGTGSACSSTSIRPSFVLTAMGLPDWQCSSAIRLSFGPCTTPQEVERCCQLIQECSNALKNTCLLESLTPFEAPENLRDGILQFRAGNSNSWVIASKENRICIIIDPCDLVAERIEHYIRCQDLKILAILDTHSHGDHESVRPLFQKVLLDHFIEPNLDVDSLGWPTNGIDQMISVQLENGEFIPALRIQSHAGRDLVLAKLETPGHTKDSLAFLLGRTSDNKLIKKDIIFTFCGDTLLCGGLGRTNFTVSDPQALFYSLRKLHHVINEYSLICPAHDYTQCFATNLAVEIQSNPLLADALAPIHPLSIQLFLENKKALDKKIAQIEANSSEIVCGVTPTKGASCAVRTPLTISFSELQAELNTSNSIFTKALILDVREPHEYELFHDWSGFGLANSPQNVPLSRFVNFIGDLHLAYPYDHPILLICRTGNRSLQAAECLRRLGFSKAVNLEGGLVIPPASLNFG